MAWLYFAIGVTGICGIVVVAYLICEMERQAQEEAKKILEMFERMKGNDRTRAD
jgi:bacteriorhodopsin